jgi:hypothetical protein
MKLRTKKQTAGLVILLGLFFTGLSCTEPDPLYGTWRDNQGNLIIFKDSGAFTASVINPVNKQSEEFTGFFSVSKNSLSLKIADPVSKTLVTEWDIRGGMLYLDWTGEDGDSRLMTLYKQ